MTALWQRLDDAYLAAFLTAMGKRSAYTTLQIVQGQIGDTWHPDDPDWKQPGLLLISDDAEQEHSGHAGASAIRVAATYRYHVVATAEATTYLAAKRAGQTLHQRLIAVLQSWPAILAAAAAADPGSTETPIRQKFDRSWIQIRGRQATKTSKYYAVAVVSWTTEATM